MSVAELDRRDVHSELREAHARLRDAWRAEPYPSAAVRRQRLEALHGAMLDRRDDIAEAIRADYGSRSRHETYLAELIVSADSIKYLIRNLEGWMKPEGRRVNPSLWMAKARVQCQPLGVVGVISPWNYPWQLAALPIATALAAGNRVMLKPSELTPATSELLAELLPAALGHDVVSVHTGGVEVGQAFSSIPFDHLFYTGSTQVGRLVMKAAAEHLTPVTLELGGKSPALMHPDFDLGRFVDRIVYGKTFNAGQTCVAPDYALVPRHRVQDFVDAFQRTVAGRYPTLVNNPDYTSIINERHHARLRGYLDDARGKGARIIEVNPGNETFEGTGHKLAPHLLLDVNDDMRVMVDEIFGPLLPVIPYDTVDQALAFVADRPRPLAFYYFDDDSRRIDDVLLRTMSGGVSINDCMLQVAVDDLPFGGVGPSGMGAYHGKEGFETFSHKRSVLRQARFNGTSMLAPPFGRTIERLIDLLLR